MPGPKAPGLGEFECTFSFYVYSDDDDDDDDDGGLVLVNTKIYFYKLF